MHGEQVPILILKRMVNLLEKLIQPGFPFFDTVMTHRRPDLPLRLAGAPTRNRATRPPK
jgi:hypothetical protein